MAAASEPNSGADSSKDERSMTGDAGAASVDFGRGEAGAGEPLDGVGEAAACRSASRVQASLSAGAFSFAFPLSGTALLSNRVQASEGAEPMLTRPRPRPAFFFGDLGAVGAVVFSASGLSVSVPKPAPILFRRAKYPDGRRNADGARGAAELVEAACFARKGARLLGSNGLGFGTSTGGVDGRVSTEPDGVDAAFHLPAIAKRLAGLGLCSESLSGSRGRLLGDGAATTLPATDSRFVVASPSALLAGRLPGEVGVIFGGGRTKGPVENGGLVVPFEGEVGAEGTGFLGEGGRKMDGREDGSGRSGFARGCCTGVDCAGGGIIEP